MSNLEEPIAGVQDSDRLNEELTQQEPESEPDTPKIPPRPNQRLTSTASSSNSIPIIPQRPSKKSSTETSDSIPTIPKRPVKETKEPDAVERSQSPIIPPRPKKQADEPTTTTTETITDSIKNTIGKVPIVGGLVHDEEENQQEQSVTPSIPQRPVKKTREAVTEEKTETSSPIIPTRPLKVAEKTEQKHVVEASEEKEESVPIIPTRPSKVSSAELEVETEEPKIPERPTEESSDKEESIKDDDVPDASESIKEEISSPVIPQRPTKAEVEAKTSPVMIEKEVFEADPIDSDPGSKPIEKATDVIDHAHEPISEKSTRDISTEAQAIDRIEQSTTDLTKLQKLGSNDSPITSSSSVPIIPKRPVRVKSTETQESKEELSSPVVGAEEEEQQRSSTPTIPARPKKLTTTSSSSSIPKTYGDEIVDLYAADSPDKSKPKLSGKAPPPVPKKPSSKIAAFQEMLRRNQEQEKEQQLQQQSKPRAAPRFPIPSEDGSDSNDSSGSVDRSKFKQNLSGLFALPGMARPGAAVPRQLAKEEEEEEQDDVEGEESAIKDEIETKEVKSDARRSRAKGPRGKRTAKVEKVEIPDHRVIKIVDIWSSGIKSEGIHYDNVSKTAEEISEPGAIVIDNDGKEEEEEEADKEVDDEYVEIPDKIETKLPETNSTIEEPSVSETTHGEDVVSVELKDSLNIPKEESGYESDINDDQSIKSLKSKPEIVQDASVKSLKSEEVESTSTVPDTIGTVVIEDPATNTTTSKGESEEFVDAHE